MKREDEVKSIWPATKRLLTIGWIEVGGTDASGSMGVTVV